MYLLLAVIRLYQRFISPHKGFRCAYHAHTGRQSCSHLGLRAVRMYGALSGLAVLRRRLYLCGVAHRRYAAPHRRPPLSQRGNCDLPCDGGCDMPDTTSCTTLGDCASNLGCDCGSCDWPERKRKNKDEKEQAVYLPPKNPKGIQ
jgi:putative component of membrane protein insertase Oxa1/YidC/SpoIIIJ protein YidD